MSIKSDRWIRRMAQEHDMINPYSEKQVSAGVISYGVSSYGYDLRVGSVFKIFTNVNSEIVDPKRFSDRCSTISFRLPNHKPIDIARHLGDRGIFTWDGNYYALNLTERLGVEEKGGLLRVGIVHYNTADEIARLLTALRELK